MKYVLKRDARNRKKYQKNPLTLDGFNSVLPVWIKNLYIQNMIQYVNFNIQFKKLKNINYEANESLGRNGCFFENFRPSTGNDVTADPPDIKILKQC